MWIILCVALVLRVSLLVASWSEPQRYFTSDSYSYDALAATMVERGEFSQLPGGPTELFRTPGYPLFLAGIYAVVGRNFHAVVAVQILLDTGLCYLVYLLGVRLCSRRVGLWAAGLQAVSTVAIISGLRILSDGLFAFMLTGTILLLVHYFQTSRWRSLIAGGFAAGAACYVRPIGLYFGAVVLVVLLLRRRSVRQAAVFAAVFAACVLPWTLRNLYKADYWGFSSLSAEAAFKFQGPYVLAKVEGISIDSARSRLEAELAKYKAAENPTPGQIESKRTSIGLGVLRRHPGVFLSMHAQGSLIVWAPGETVLLELPGIETGNRKTGDVLIQNGMPAAIRHYVRGQMWVLWVFVPFGVILLGRYVLAGIGALGHVRWRMGPSAWLMILAVLLFTLLPGVFGRPRFRIPVTPMLNIAAAAGLVWFIDRIRRRRQGRPTTTTD